MLFCVSKCTKYSDIFLSYESNSALVKGSSAFTWSLKWKENPKKNRVLNNVCVGEGGTCTQHDVLENVCIGYCVKTVAYKTIGTFANVKELKGYKQHCYKTIISWTEMWFFLSCHSVTSKGKTNEKEITQQDFLKQGPRYLQGGGREKWLLSKSRNISYWQILTFWFLSRH